MTLRRNGVRTAIFLTLCAVAVVMLYPFWYMGLNAFRSLDQYNLGRGFSLSTWGLLFDTLPVGRQLLNSTLITLGAIAVIVGVATTAGFASR